MSMGSTGTINMAGSMLEAAKTAIDNYMTTISGLNSELSGIIEGLIPGDFSGSAATSFLNFYNDTIITENINTDADSNLKKMMDSLSELCDSIKKSIPGEEDGVDEQLAGANTGVASEG